MTTPAGIPATVTKYPPADFTSTKRLKKWLKDERGVTHPALFNDPHLDYVEQYMHAGERWLDPYAGVGCVHLLRARIRGLETYGIELEPEWATCSPYNTRGNAERLPFPDASFDGVVTSPTFANRMNEAWNISASDRSEKRNTYQWLLGRWPHPLNTGRMKWGDGYRGAHVKAWPECFRVLCPDGLMLVNVKDSPYTRTKKDAPTKWRGVHLWHEKALRDAGFEIYDWHEMHSPGNRYGAGRDQRADVEFFIVAYKPGSST